MLSHISWHDYWLYAGLTTLLYYLFIAAFYYRSEILALIAGRSKKDTTASAAVPLPEKEKQLQGAKEYYPLAEAEESDVLVIMEELAEELSAVLTQFGSEDINNEALVQRLILTLHDFGHTDAVYSFRQTLRQHISEQVAAINHLQLDRDTLYRIVPEKRSGWKAGFTVLLAMLISMIARAQDGNAGISEATSKVKSYFTTGCNLMYAIGAVVGLVGAVKVFNKWNSGEPDTGRVAAAWFGSCIFLVVVATVLKSFFNV